MSRLPRRWLFAPGRRHKVPAVFLLMLLLGASDINLANAERNKGK